MKRLPIIQAQSDPQFEFLCQLRQLRPNARFVALG
jgi:hypothetical protein